MRTVDLAIVGGGPAALAAASEAAGAGLRSIIVIDENRALGGQYYRRLPAEFRVDGAATLGRTYAEGEKLVGKVVGTRTSPIEVLTDTAVWGILPDEGILSLANAEHCWDLKASVVILAMGAYDRPVAFPGWTLPGVVTAGAAQIMAKTYRVLPGRRVLVAGSGPLLLALTKQLLDIGAEVAAVVEARPLGAWWQYVRHAPALWGSGGTLRDGWSYLKAMRSAKVPYLTGHTIVSAQGTSEVEQAVVARLDGRSRPVSGTERTWFVDSICLGFGFLPSTELAKVCGCRLDYVAAWGCYAPRVDRWMESTVPNLFVAGDVAGIRGAEIAKEQGRLAAVAIAHRLGVLGQAQLEQRERPIRRRLGRLLRFRQMVDELYTFDPELCTNLLTPDTIVCRCEEITAGEIAEAIAEGGVDANGGKMRSPAGMGPSQGRNCSPVVTQIHARQAREKQDGIEQFSLRPPVKPVPMGVLATCGASPAPAAVPGAEEGGAGN
jgi:thioredoxin reductase